MKKGVLVGDFKIAEIMGVTNIIMDYESITYDRLANMIKEKLKIDMFQESDDRREIW